MEDIEIESEKEEEEAVYNPKNVPLGKKDSFIIIIIVNVPLGKKD